jgi:hypothetical protein
MVRSGVSVTRVPWSGTDRYWVHRTVATTYRTYMRCRPTITNQVRRTSWPGVAVPGRPVFAFCVDSLSLLRTEPSSILLESFD